MEKSTHKVEIVKLTEIFPHPNADKMELCKVFGFVCCIGKGQFRHGDLVAYVQPDSVVPHPDEGFPGKEYYEFLNKGEAISEFKLRRRRITVKKLRGIYSQGLIIPAPNGSNEGDDVAGLLGVTHYEPPENTDSNGGGKIKSGDMEKAPDGNYPHYDVDSFKRYGKAFEEGEEIVASGKIHGANSLFCYRNGEFYVRSRTTWKRVTKEILFNNTEGFWNTLKLKLKIFFGKKKVSMHPSDWWVALEKNPSVKRFLKENPKYSIYGEIYGKVQDLHYGKEGLVEFVAFDIMEISTGRFLDWDESQEFQAKYDIPWVPLVYRGPFNEELMNELAEHDDLLALRNGVEGHIQEGIVIKPVKERFNERIGRVQLKLVSNRYYDR